MESAGLGLMILAVLLALLQMGLGRVKGPSEPSARRWVNYLNPLMLGTLLLGVLLLTWTWVLYRPIKPEIESQMSTPSVHSPVSTVESVLPPEPVSTSTSKAAKSSEPLSPMDVPDHAPVNPHAAAFKATAKVKVPASEPASPAPPQVMSVVTTPVSNSKSNHNVSGTADKSTFKEDIFRTRCTRILEKAGSGEPMSEAERMEMVSKCQ
jgi:cytoskeletal protein RodZ